MAIGYAGINAIRERSYDLPWRSTTTLAVGPLSAGRQITGIEHYRGGEAIRVGGGLLSFGAMLSLWGVALFFPQGRPWGGRQQLLGIASLLCLLTTVVLIFPPWRIFSAAVPSAFYGALGLAGVVAMTVQKHARWVCMGIVAAGVLLDGVWHGLALGTGLGLLACLTIGGHVLLLVPRFRRDSTVPSGYTP